jgi:hypothetical protein
MPQYVKALQQGHYLIIREEGDVFEVPDDFVGAEGPGSLPTWVKAAKTPAVEEE